MESLVSIYNSSIGKKLTMALTGIFLCTYLVVHIGGNFLLFKNDGGAAFDTYAEILPTILVIRIIEVGLFALFFLHIILGTYLWAKNKQARPEKYAVNRTEENSAVTSRVMFLTGSIVFIFLVIHVRTFWFTSRFQAGEHFSMYALVKESLTNPWYAGLYVIAMVLLGFHLHHGFQSAFQTFGIKGKKYEKLIELAGIIFWLLIPLGFAAMPLYFLMNS